MLNSLSVITLILRTPWEHQVWWPAGKEEMKTGHQGPRPSPGPPDTAEAPEATGMRGLPQPVYRGPCGSVALDFVSGPSVLYLFPPCFRFP